ncbi:hypothetical protein ABW20_dc0105282 [Dactylellina cionopaga]|nr:hypothetical protein ABW20_dc0105282 [Dactylellina cionopaga]
MRLVLFKNLTSSLLLCALFVEALPSGSRVSDTSVEKREPEAIENGAAIPVIRKEEPEPVQIEEAQPGNIDARDINLKGFEKIQSHIVEKREPGWENASNMVDSIPNIIVPGSEKRSTKEINTPAEGLGKRTPPPEPTLKPHPEPVSAYTSDAYIKKRHPEPFDRSNYEPETIESLIDILRRSNGDPDIKAKLRARVEEELQKRDLIARQTQDQRYARIHREHMKRFYQLKSPLQEYRNALPPSAYAADDGSFGHSISSRDHMHAFQKRSEEAYRSAPRNDNARRAILEARLRELGYVPDPDATNEDPNNLSDKRRLKRDEIEANQMVKRDEVPKPNKLKKRDFDPYLGCPSLRLMNSASTIFFNPDSFKNQMGAFRNACFKCGCRANTGGWFMFARPDWGCTERLAANCVLAGCMCSANEEEDAKWLMPKPAWQNKSGAKSFYSFEVFDPLSDATYSGKDSAEAGINEARLGLRRRDETDENDDDESYFDLDNLDGGEEKEEEGDDEPYYDRENFDDDAKLTKRDGPVFGVVKKPVGKIFYSSKVNAYISKLIANTL